MSFKYHVTAACGIKGIIYRICCYALVLAGLRWSAVMGGVAGLMSTAVAGGAQGWRVLF